MKTKIMMKNNRLLTRVPLLLFLFMSLPTRLLAYTDGEFVKFNGMFFRIVSGKEATMEIIGVDETKTGKLVIPATITDDKGVLLTVIGLGNYYNEYSFTNITDVVLPPTAKYIYGNPHWNTTLKSFYIPKSVVSIKNRPWFNFDKANPKVIVEEGNPMFVSSSAGELYSKDKSILYSVPSDIPLVNGTYTVASSVTDVHSSSFNSCKGLKHIVLPSNLKSLNISYMFLQGCNQVESFSISENKNGYWCQDGILYQDNKLLSYPPNNAIKDLTLPDKVTAVGSYAFNDENENGIRSINFNNAVDLAFESVYAARNLKSVTLSKNMTVADWKGGIVAGLSSVQLPANHKYLIVKDGVLFSKDMTELLYCPSRNQLTTDKYTIPNGVKKIHTEAFRLNVIIKSITIPNTVEDMGDECFREAQTSDVVFQEPAKIKALRYRTFYRTKIKTFTLPTSVETIDWIWGYNEDVLEKIIIPAGSRLKTFSCYNSSLPNFKSIEFLGDCALETIGDEAFANLPNFEGITIPKTVKNIGRNAFSGCKNMTYATFASDAQIENIGQNAFGNCGLKSITIPQSVKTIDREAFKNCAVLETVNVPAGTTLVSPEAFKFCNNLTAINVATDNQMYSSSDGILLTKDKKTLVSFPAGKANDKFTLLPPSITKIGDYAFYECRKLKNVVIPQKVISIGERAFGLCANLNTVTMLCDKMINPENIAQGVNKMAFDDGTQAADMLSKISLYVREDQKENYELEDFYSKFKKIKSSFHEYKYSRGADEYINTSETDVMLLGANLKRDTYVVPKEVMAEGKTCVVSSIGDYAFQNNKTGVKEVVVGKQIDYIGAKAFITDIDKNESSISSVFFLGTAPSKNQLSTIRFDLDDTGDKYNEIADNTRIYVKKSSVSAYKKAWRKMGTTNNYTQRIDYKIKDFAISAKYGTFAREFDADFSDFNRSNGTTEIAAFVSGTGMQAGSGDYGDGSYHIRMRSIDEKGGDGNNYGYIPAGTGVLLKVIDKDTHDTPVGFYYTIGEQDDKQFDVEDNIMHGVTEIATTVKASSTAPVWVMQGGLFRKATSDIADFPAHKAYLKLPAGSAGVKQIVFDFEDRSGSTTGVQTVLTAEERETDSRTYNLQGQRVDMPQHGIYIRGGKKIIVK